MTNAFIFHGTDGYPEENWFPWLKAELKKINITTIIPQFPTPTEQTPETWFKVLETYEDQINQNTIIFGHSLGGVFLLRLLEKFKIKAAIFVATPIGIPPIKNIETDKPFLEKPFNWNKINKSAKKFFVFHSNNDPYVGLENGKQLAKNLSTDLTFIPNAGHFNKNAGYLQFNELLEIAKNLV